MVNPVFLIISIPANYSLAPASSHYIATLLMACGGIEIFLPHRKLIEGEHMHLFQQE